VAYLVGQRTQEIGVRRALGAQALEIVGMLVRESMRPVATGIAVGLLGAFALSRVLAAMLFEVSSTDVATYAIACGVLGIAALLASVIPARRALSVDPISAVRGQ
jgi:ABC-type antimicrobial peptide transport system permease subunit